jgi:DNA-binding PadR family transcriptional regulator
MKQAARNRLSPEFAILGFLYLAPCHGYDLHKRLRFDLGNIWHGSQSQTYNIIKRLEGRRYIVSTFIEQEKLPARQLLHITAAGKKHFEEWLELPTNCSVHAIRVDFITRLYFIKLYQPERVGGAIREQMIVVNDGLAQLQAHRTSSPGKETIDQMALDLRIKLLASVIDWLEECYRLEKSSSMIG